MGTLHGSVSLEHMQAYFDEWVFRFNRRSSRSRGLLFQRLLQQAVEGDAVSYLELVKAGLSIDPDHTPVVNDPYAAGDLSRIHIGLLIFTRDNLDRHGGPQLWDITERLGSAPGAEPVVELGGGDGSGHEVALRLVAAQTRQLGVGDFCLDAFGDYAQAEAVGQG